MRPTLRVHVNRDGPRSVEPEESSIDVDGPFDVILENHGQSAHVHVHADDDLAAVTTVEETNWYVDEGDVETVPVSVQSIDAETGTLEIVTGYGAERSTVDVDVAAGSGGVEVDENLATIQPEDEPDTPATGTYRVAVAFVVAGLLVAIGIAVLVDDLAAVLVGLATVTLAVGTSVYLVLLPRFLD
ncbi:MAG: hypothetical protein ABEJ44_02090 [Halanaeroarchaeum sp.]